MIIGNTENYDYIMPFKNFELEKFFSDAFKFKKPVNESCLKSYIEFIKYFKDLKEITTHELIIGINFTYGWMPTTFKFKLNNFEEALVILNKVKQGIIPQVEELQCLKSVFNNSMVGTSKLLHFINPQKMAIWDSHIYYYLTDQKAYRDRIGNIKTYLKYLELCAYVSKQPDFEKVQKKIEIVIDYKMTPFRIVEIVMYSNRI